MQTHKLILLVTTVLCTITMGAQNVYDVYPERIGGKKVESQKSKVESRKSKVESQKSKVESQKSKVESQKSKAESRETKEESKRSNGIFTGFTGGMKLHIGYAFSKSPDELFRNGSLQDLASLPSDGVTIGLGGELRVHLGKHIHLGADGGMSTMPLMKSGSSVRTGWGGAIIDYYFSIGKVDIILGGCIGGGSSKRLFVPEDAATVSGTDEVVYNSSYTKTPFFMLDPYLGVEVHLTQRMGLLIQLDYILPFGSDLKGINTETIRWSNFLTPSGPRLYVGLMFGRHD